MADIHFISAIFIHQKMQKSYSENPAYYKRLIAQINTEANFPAYLQHLGYKLMKKSAGSLEFSNGEDRLVLNISRNPVTYFNRNDSTDKGLFFKFIRKNQSNFYKTIEVGLEIINRAYELDESSLTLPNKVKNSKTLEENYNIAPLQKVDYLVRHRGLSEAVLNDELFQGRIFNAFHIRDNGGKIGNIAFPKYDLKGNPKNYILYNKPYFDRRENRQRKFRLTLNKKDHFLFYSKPIPNPKNIIFGESAIDLLSYHELHGTPENFYISFGGSIYPEKLAFFAQLTEPYLGNEKTAFISIMDNDKAGQEFDIKVFSTLVNQWHPNIYIEHAFKQGRVDLTVHYVKAYRKRISQDKSTIEAVLKSDFKNVGLPFDFVQPVAFSDKLVLEFSLDELDKKLDDKQKNAFKLLLETIGKLYLPFTFGIHKSNGKDWNDDLRESKKTKYIKTSKVLRTAIGVGDKIDLKTALGPEGSTNKGKVVLVQENSVLCDFGLQYNYSIPYSSIKMHHQRVSSKTLSTRKGTKKKSDKNRTLSIS